MKNDDDKLKSTELQEKKKKKAPSLMKKLKLRARRSSIAEEIRIAEERKTPEGDDHIKSASETDLTEVSWRSADNLSEVDSVKSVVSTTLTKSLENIKVMPPFGELMVDEQEAMVKISNRENVKYNSHDRVNRILE